MSDLVSSAIGARMREEQDNLRPMLIVSVAVHVAVLVLIAVMPQFLGLGSRAPETVMTISIPGTVSGANTGGMTPLSGRPVQQVTPKPELPRPEPVRPPAAKPPDMVEPSKTTRPTPPRPQVAQTPPKASSRTPTGGEQVKPGAGIDPKGAPTREAGLSTGTAGDNSQVALGNFCDPQYLAQMITLIHRNWNERQSVVGTPVVRFIIQRDGTLTDASLKQSSGYQMLDFVATRAVAATKAIPPLPSCYPYDAFIVNLTFEYTR
jgi:periplasmic protein TonB